MNWPTWKRRGGFEFIALQKSAVEALLIDEATRRRYVSLARQVRTTFKALLPDPAAQAVTHRVAVIRSLAAKLESSSEAPDISDVMDSVSELLDRSVGAEEYVIRAGGDAGQLVDLNRLDFEQLALRFAGNKRTAAKQIEQNLDQRLDVAVRKNPTRIDLAERFRKLIDESPVLLRSLNPNVNDVRRYRNVRPAQHRGKLRELGIVVGLRGRYTCWTIRN